MLLKWSKSFLIGHDIIDMQHMKLLDLINDLHTYVLSHDKNLNTINSMIGDLFNYTVTHFKDEENIMILYKYPNIENHKKEHITFIEMLNNSFTGKTDYTNEDVMTLFNFLADWLLNHIAVEDTAISQYIKSI